MANDSLKVSYKTVAYIALVVAVSAITALAVVATVKNADTLSVVALALAVIAFVVQLLVFIAQLFASNAQQTQVQDIYTAMQQTLAMIAERTHGTEQTITRLNERLLEHVLGKAASEVQVAGLVGTPVESAETIAERVRENVTHRQSKSKRDREQDVAVTRFLETWPSPEEVDALAAVLKAADDLDLRALRILTRDERLSRSPASSLRPGVWTESADNALTHALVNLGVVEAVPQNEGVLLRLTDLGRSFARLFVAPDPVPDYMAPLVGALPVAEAVDLREGVVR